ncbi:unnamed protein product [Tenebrio molitor]|nr:unnamed protein product [Tenebrio molitor]
MEIVGQRGNAVTDFQRHQHYFAPAATSKDGGTILVGVVSRKKYSCKYPESNNWCMENL